MADERKSGRFKNHPWAAFIDPNSGIPKTELACIMCVLMDLRDELQALNKRLAECTIFVNNKME